MESGILNLNNTPYFTRKDNESYSAFLLRSSSYQNAVCRPLQRRESFSSENNLTENLTQVTPSPYAIYFKNARDELLRRSPEGNTRALSPAEQKTAQPSASGRAEKS